MDLTLDYLNDLDDGSSLIRIFGRDEVAMRRFIDAMEDLQAEGPMLTLGPEHGITPVNCELSIVRRARERTSLRELTPRRRFLWTLDEWKYDNVVGLLEPFQELKLFDAYQWLEDDSGVDADGRPLRILLSASDRGVW